MSLEGTCDQQAVDGSNSFAQANAYEQRLQKRRILEDEPETVQVFKIMYGTYKPYKKHKQWENDAILLRKGRRVTMKDMSGRSIESEFNYSKNKLMEVDEHIILGTYECLLEEEITYDDYKEGRCFTNCSTHAITVQEAPKSFMPVKRRFFLTKSRIRPADNNSSEPPEKQPRLGLYSQYRSPITQQSQTETQQQTQPLQAINQKQPQTGTQQAQSLQHNQKQLQQASNGSRPFILPALSGERPVIVEARLASRLRPHQREGIEFMYDCIMGRRLHGSGCILADDMGLGKTLQCITLIHTLLHSGPQGNPLLKRVIIITPLSLVKNWKKEFDKWIPGANFYIYDVSSNKNHSVAKYMKLPSSSQKILIISYEMFVKHEQELSQINFDLLVCDEGHRLKNAKVKASQAITNSILTDRKILLTGTPVQNHLGELYHLCNLVNPGCLGSLSHYKRMYEGPITAGMSATATKEEAEASLGKTEALFGIFSDFILRREQDELQQYLPSKVETILICKPTDLQSNIYGTIMGTNDALLSEQDLRDMPTTSLLPYISYLRKLCNHPFLVNSIYARNELSPNSLIHRLQSRISPMFRAQSRPASLEGKSGKFDVLIQMLRVMNEAQQKVVIVSNFTQTLQIIAQYCCASNYPFVKFDGSVSKDERQKMIEQLNKPNSEIFAFLLSSKAGGVGLNLVGASNLILYDIDWNPANDLQAMARIWRDGQKKTARIYRLITAGTIEEKMLQRQLMKQGYNCTVKNMSSELKFSFDDIRDIFTIDTSVLCTTHNAIGCFCNIGLPTDITQMEEEDLELEVEEEGENDTNALTELDDEAKKALGLNDYSAASKTFGECLLDLDDNDSLAAAPLNDSENDPFKEIDDDLDNDAQINDTESLLSWDHMAYPFENCDLEDKCIWFSRSNINFIFRKTVNKGKQQA